MGILAYLNSTLSQWAINTGLWVLLLSPDNAQPLGEFIILCALCYREDPGVMDQPDAAVCVGEMLDGERDATAALLAMKKLLELPGVKEHLTARDVRRAYGVPQHVRFVTKGHDLDTTMRDLAALRTKLAAAAVPHAPPSGLLTVEASIRAAHHVVDAAARLAHDGVLDEGVLFPEKGLARTHDDVKQEIAECSRFNRAQWEDSLPKGISKDEKRLAFREYTRAAAAADVRGEGSLAVWRRERRALVQALADG
ncbi:uncharacterized protein LOC62_04G006575 [Vanrija pseudolonga]|uniref:Uncharacterized protein n=1 Tax=Vanrija pseudolonga TaxID=143232 RepID=A0AAF0YFY4_9TREE|nr:hypothetical protein LOC62_04G006575 [Vanrija pseudolonga]